MRRPGVCQSGTRAEAALEWVVLAVVWGVVIGELGWLGVVLGAVSFTAGYALAWDKRRRSRR